MCTGLTGAQHGLLWSSIGLMIVSLACITGGAVLITGKSAYGSELDFLKDDLSTSAADAGNAGLDVSGLDVRFVTLPLGITLCVAAVFILAISILGIIAAAGRFYKFIIVFICLLAILYFSQIVVIICAYVDRDAFDSTVKDFLKDSLDGYTGIDGEDSFTLGWSGIMSYYQCCGVDSFVDFVVEGVYPRSEKGQMVQAPVICCIDKTTATAGNCATAANFQTQTFFNRGCYDHMWDHVTSYTSLIIFTVFSIVVLEFLCLFFAIWRVCFRKSQGPTKVADYDHYN